MAWNCEFGRSNFLDSWWKDCYTMLRAPNQQPEILLHFNKFIPGGKIVI